MSAATLSPSDKRYAADLVADLARQGAAVRGVTTDSRQVTPGMAFAAYPGLAQDGRSHIAAAVAAGASGVLWEAEGFVWDDAVTVPNVAVHRLKQRISAIAAKIYDEPSRDLWTIGVTGTNGKTSCTHWLAQALTQAGRKAAVMGTLGNGVPPELAPSGNTTGDAARIQAALAQFRAQGVKAVAMEVSSEGLDQGRVNAVKFDIAVLTNLTRDHLDYHGDMDRYAAVKARLFSWPGLTCAVLNQDDEFGRALIEAGKSHPARVLSYGFGQADVRGSALKLYQTGLSLWVDSPWGSTELHTRLLGRFNAHNLLASLAALLVSDVSLAQAAELLAEVMPPVGRMQTLGGKHQPLVVVDYAHTPDALENVLATLREISTEACIYCVFGCGGDRDVGKRPQMGDIASRLADQAVVTSDNPRSENPMTIINDIRAGMNGTEWVEIDREKAIARALHAARAGDVVLIAGKGHEAYQETQGVKSPFSDVDVASRLLESWV